MSFLKNQTEQRWVGFFLITKIKTQEDENRIMAFFINLRQLFPSHSQKATARCIILYAILYAIPAHRPISQTDTPIQLRSHPSIPAVHTIIYFPVLIVVCVFSPTHVLIFVHQRCFFLTVSWRLFVELSCQKLHSSKHTNS